MTTAKRKRYPEIKRKKAKCNEDGSFTEGLSELAKKSVLKKAIEKVIVLEEPKYILSISQWLPVSDINKAKQITGYICTVVKDRKSLIEAVAECILSSFQNDINIFKEGVPFKSFLTSEWDFELQEIFKDSGERSVSLKAEREAADKAKALMDLGVTFRKALDSYPEDVIEVVMKEMRSTPALTTKK